MLLDLFFFLLGVWGACFENATSKFSLHKCNDYGLTLTRQMLHLPIDILHFIFVTKGVVCLWLDLYCKVPVTQRFFLHLTL